MEDFYFEFNFSNRIDDFIFILTSFANNTFLARRTFYDITRHTPVITNLAADGSTSL